MKFELTEEEFKALYNYFLFRAGYVSPEFDLPIWELFRRMEKYNKLINEEKNENEYNRPNS